MTVGGDGVVRFSHPLVASAVYESPPPAAGSACTALLAEQVVDPEERARHLALAATGPDERPPRRSTGRPSRLRRAEPRRRQPS